jgi:ATP-dependent Clp protease protease subunit
MLHQPSGAARGQASDINNEARELLRLRAYLSATLAASTGKSAEQTAKDFARDRYFTPDQAVEYGLIDRVIYPRRNKIPM